MNTSWVDILPPTPPEETISVQVWLLTIAGLFFLFVILSWYRSSKQKCFRALNLLEAQYRNNHNIEDIPLNLRKIIKQRFNVKNINHITTTNIEDWKKYKKKLTKNSFSGNNINRAELESLIAETRYWIKQKGHGNA